MLKHSWVGCWCAPKKEYAQAAPHIHSVNPVDARTHMSIPKFIITPRHTHTHTFKFHHLFCFHDLFDWLIVLNVSYILIFGDAHCFAHLYTQLHKGRIIRFTKNVKFLDKTMRHQHTSLSTSKHYFMFSFHTLLLLFWVAL